MTQYVICAVEVEGFHCWPGAPENLDYLQNRHRHVFQIRMAFEVTHGDREIEINLQQSKIKRYLRAKYASDQEEACAFGAMSCEQIAAELLLKFGACSCQVLEDGYGGAKVVR